MDQFNDAVVAAVQKMHEDGSFKTIIEEQVAKTVRDVVGNAVRSYGPFGKQLEKAVTEALAVDTTHLGLGGYNQIVLEIVRRKIEGAFLTVAKEQLEADMAALLSARAPSKITITNLYRNLTAWAREHHAGCGAWGRPTLIVESSQYSSRWLYMDPKSGLDKYGCAIHALVRDEDGTVASLRISGKDVSKTLFAGSLYEFEADLFRLYTAKVPIEFDVEDADDIYIEDDQE